METEWHYSTNGEQHGPVSGAYLKQLASDGSLRPTDLVWKQGLDTWIAVSKVDGIFPKRSTQPPPLPSSSTESELLVAAEHNHLQATFCLSECQAHLQVYRRHLTDKARDGLELVDAALRAFPDSSDYLNTKALLLSDGMGRHPDALALLRRAMELEPQSVIVDQNIRKVQALVYGLPGDLTHEDLLARAEHNHLQATFCLNECQAHLEVYGSHLTGRARDGLELVDAALADFPESSDYLNTKALLLSDGMGRHQDALTLLRRALAFEPHSVVIRQNIRKIEGLLRGCFSVVLAILTLLGAASTSIIVLA